jgi:phosphoglycolate phosphatase-like HAD superfamily hydrolase
MRLVVFDIDGTLTESTETDAECFVRSLSVVCGFDRVETDWSLYKHVTDAGLFHEIHQARTGQAPSAAETSRFREYFINLLAQASAKSPFTPIAGAPRLLDSLSGDAQHRVALATGAWSDSARLKLSDAGMRFEDYPAASSDDAFDRESILRLAVQRASAQHGRFDSVVYIGDGVWDARACRAIGIPFIGIATGVRAVQLAAEGAVCVFPDLSARDLFFKKLGEITPFGPAI